MGMEESESEDEQQPIASTSMVQPTKSTAEEEAEAMKNDPLCYYDNMANGADVSHLNYHLLDNVLFASIS